MTMELKFNGSNTVDGNGSDELGSFTVTGEYSPSPPYNAKLLRTDSNGTMEMSGFRESEGGGIFGQWKGNLGAGDFHVKPADKNSPAVLKMKEQQRKGKLEQLETMGFEKWLCEQALEESNEDVGNAIEWLTRQTEGGSALLSNTSGNVMVSSTGNNSVDEGAVKTVMGMGFPEERARTALASCENDVAAAIDWLFTH